MVVLIHTDLAPPFIWHTQYEWGSPRGESRQSLLVATRGELRETSIDKRCSPRYTATHTIWPSTLMIQLLHNLPGQVSVLIREPWAVAGMMKRNTGKQAALLLPSLPRQALGQSEQRQAPACYHVRENCLGMFTNGSWGRSTEEVVKIRKGRGDEAVGEGMKGTMMLASGLAESRKWQCLQQRGLRVYDY